MTLIKSISGIRGTIGDREGEDLTKNDIILYTMSFGFWLKSENRVKSNKSNIGILVCGSGTGMAMSANKIKGIRAAVCYNLKSTRLSRQHNDANIISIGSRLTKKKDIKKIIAIFLKTKFEGGRHNRRIKKI